MLNTEVRLYFIQKFNKKVKTTAVWHSVKKIILMMQNSTENVIEGFGFSGMQSKEFMSSPDFNIFHLIGKNHLIKTKKKKEKKQNSEIIIINQRAMKSN